MANNQIGVSFLPSQENQDMGMQRGQMEGDLGQALKILSLRMPRVVGAQALTPQSNMGGGLSSAVPRAGTVGGEQGAFNPNAALFESLIKALLSGTNDAGLSGGMGPLGAKTTTTGGSTNPIFKFITTGEPNPGTFDPITTEDQGGDPIYRKPETNWGAIGRSGDLSAVNGDVAGYGRMPRKMDPNMSYTSIP